MRSVLDAVLDHFEMYLKTEKIPSHLVAITDPGSDLEKRAHDEGWRACFLGEPTVGGRFSALSVFGLVPAALVGIDLGGFLGHAKDAERVCSEDSIDNPAITLASFLYDNYLNGRDKFSFLTPKRGRVLGLWIEQLVAESLGKQGVGICRTSSSTRCFLPKTRKTAASSPTKPKPTCGTSARIST